MSDFKYLLLKCAELEKEKDDLLRLLATERDDFGKKEIEMLGAIGKLWGALKGTLSHIDFCKRFPENISAHGPAWQEALDSTAKYVPTHGEGKP
jgi:hypothetical protein